MGEILLKLGEQLNSSVFVLLALLFVVVWCVYKLGILRERFSHHEKRLDKADESHDLLVRMSAKLEYVYEFTNPRSIARSQSPLALTDLGRETSEAIQADSIYSRHCGVLLGNMESACPKGTNAYDIQLAARKIAENDFPNLLTANELNSLKQVAFEKGLVLEDMWLIFAIKLRDDVLKERGIPVGEVDKTTPPI